MKVPLRRKLLNLKLWVFFIPFLVLSECHAATRPENRDIITPVQNNSDESSHHNTQKHDGSSLSRGAVQPGMTDVIYVRAGKTANLNCGPVLSSDDKVSWRKNNGGKGWEDVTQDKCQILSDGEHEFAKCGFLRTAGRGDSYTFTLRIKNITDDDYKTTYQCKTEDMTKDFKLRADLKVTRKIQKDTIRSIILTEGEILELFCNYTLNPGEKDISEVDFLKVTWLKDGEDITEDLRTKGGLFVNFTDTSPNGISTRGVSTHAHRGVYKCNVNLRQKNDSVKHISSNKHAYPMEFLFSVRVRDGKQWMLPGGILIVEILGMAIFTAIIWRREDKKDNENEVNEPEDSDDDEDDKNTKL